MPENSEFSALQQQLTGKAPAKPAPRTRAQILRDKVSDHRASEAKSSAAAAKQGDLNKAKFMEENVAHGDLQYVDETGRVIDLPPAPPDTPQPETIPALAEEAVEARDAASVSAPSPEPYEELTSALSPDREAKAIKKVGDNLAAREKAADKDWIDFDRSVLEQASTVLTKMGYFQEDYARTWLGGFEVGDGYRIPGLNAVPGVDMALPGMSDEEAREIKEHLIQAKTIKEEISKETGINPDWLELDASPQGKRVALSYNGTVKAITDARRIDLLREAEARADGRQLTPQEKSAINVKAHEYGIRQADRAVSSASGRNFPVMERDDITKWIRSWSPAYRPLLTSVFQSNSTIIVNGQVYEEDLTQNTFFGGLEYGTNFITFLSKPFAAGSDQKATLGKEDILKFLDTPPLWAAGSLSAMAAVELGMPDGYETTLPWGIESEAEIEAMRRGEDPVSQHKGMGKALAHRVYNPGEDAGLVEQAGGAMFRTWLRATNRMNPVGMYLLSNGWTDEDLLGLQNTAAFAVLEPDALIALAPVSGAVKMTAAVVKSRRAAKVVTATQEALTELDTPIAVLDKNGEAVLDALGNAVTELPVPTPKTMGKKMAEVTGVDTSNFMEKVILARTSELMSEDADVGAYILSQATKVQEAAAAHAKTVGEEKAALTPLLRQYNAIDQADAKARLAYEATIDARNRRELLRGQKPPASAQVAGRGKHGAIDPAKIDKAAQIKLKNATAAEMLKTNSLLATERAKHGNDLKQRDMAIDLRDKTAVASKGARDDKAQATTAALAEVKRLAAEVEAIIGSKAPRAQKATQRLLSVHADPGSVATIKAYRKALADLAGVRKQHTPIVKARAAAAGRAQAALQSFKHLTPVVSKISKYTTRMRQLNNTLSRRQLLIKAARNFEQDKALTESIKTASEAQKVATDLGNALRKVVGKKAARSGPQFNKMQEKSPLLTDRWKQYRRQATREMYQAIQDHAGGVAKIPHTSTGEIDQIINKVSRNLSADGMTREIDGDKLRKILAEEGVSKYNPATQKVDSAWMRIPQEEAQFVQKILGGATLAPDKVGYLKTSISHLIRAARQPERTQPEELAKLFWEEVVADNAILTGFNYTRRGAQTLRSMVNWFGQQARSGPVSQGLVDITNDARRTASRMQQEIYGVLFNGGRKEIMAFFDTTKPLDHQYGTTITNQGTETLYSQFLTRARSLKTLSDAAVDDASITTLLDSAHDILAVSRAFLPDGVTYSPKLGGALTKAILKTLAEKPPGSADKFYNALPNIVADVIVAHNRPNELAAVLREIHQNAKRTDSAGNSRHFAAFAGGIAHGAIMKRTNDALLQTTLGKYTVEDVAAANALMHGSLAAESADLFTAVKILNDMGLTLNPKATQQPGLGDRFKDLVLTSGDTSGGAAFIPKVLLDDINSSIEFIVKDLYAQAADAPALAPVQRFLDAAEYALRAIVIGQVRGYGLPKPKRFTNLNFQNASQIAVNEGVGMAALVAARSLGSNVSWVVPFKLKGGLKVARAKMSEQMGGVPIVGTLFEAIHNPTNARIFNGERGVLKLVGGGEMTFDEVRQLAVRTGIMEGTLRGELGSQLREGFSPIRKKPNGDDWEPSAAEQYTAWGALKHYKAKFRKGMTQNDNFVTDAIETAEQRQRVELLLGLLERGVEPEAAAERTIDALFDWSSPLGQWETETMLRRIPFYRVFRNGAQHAGRSLTEPFTAPTGDYIARGLIGQTRLGRTRAQARVANMYSELGDHDPMTEGMQEQSDVAPWTAVTPGWVTGRNMSRVDRMGQEQSDQLLARTGKRYDQITTLTPALSALEELDMVIGVAISGVGMTMAALAYAEPDWDGDDGGYKSPRFVLPADFFGRLLETSSDYIGVVTPEILDWISLVFNNQSGKTKEVTKGEAALVDHILTVVPAIDPILFGRQIKQNGSVHISETGMAILKVFPMFGPQWLDVYKAWHNHTDESDPGYLRAWETFAHSVGVSREYYGNSVEERQRRAADVIRALDAIKVGVE